MENLDDKIEQYLLGELSGETLSQFEAALATDADLQASVAKHRELLDRLEALRMRKKVQVALATPSRKRSFFSRNVIWAAAACLILGIAAWWLLTPKNLEKTPEFAQNPLPTSDSTPVPRPAPPPLPPSQNNSPNRSSPIALARSFHKLPDAASLRDIISGNQGAKTLSQLAKEAFGRGEYALVAEMLKADNTVSQDENARYLRAHARFQTGQFAGAALDFEALLSSFQYKHDARWNYLLCQVALDKKTLAKSQLREMLEDPDFPYRKDAIALSRQF